MALEFPPEIGPLPAEWFAPLTLVAASVAGERAAHFLDIADFMVTARVIRPPRPTIVEYKHVHTRSCLRLDAAGQAYRFVPVRGSENGRYLRRPLGHALAALGLDELPWMKPGLEGERRGLAWEDRVILTITLDREFSARGRPRRRDGELPLRPRPPLLAPHIEAAAVADPEGGARHGRLHLV